MAAQKGRDVLIKVSDGATPTPTFNNIGGLRSRAISLNQEQVDVTDGESTNQWRELLANAGIRSASITGSGIFKDSASEEDVRGYFFDGSHEDYQFVIPDFGTIEGPFQVAALDYAGEHNDSATYSMTFESAGALTWTAA